MKLYSGPLSLYSRKVEIALHEKRIGFEQVLVPFTQTRGYSPKHPDVLAANPKGQVPVLHVDGRAIYDSTVILEYLEEAHPAPPLYPATPGDRAECRMLELFADEVMMSQLRHLLHRTEPRAAAPSRWDVAEQSGAAAEKAIAGQLENLQDRLGSAEFFCGAFSVADIALFTSMHWGRRLGAPAPCAALLGWYERLAQRRAFARVVGEIGAADELLSAPVLRRW